MFKVYRVLENVQLTESFKINTQEIERLKKSNKALSIENQKLKEERDGNNDLVKERVELAAKQATNYHILNPLLSTATIKKLLHLGWAVLALWLPCLSQ